jgi:hypothetical protein
LFGHGRFQLDLERFESTIPSNAVRANRCARNATGFGGEATAIRVRKRRVRHIGLGCGNVRIQKARHHLLLGAFFMN